MSFDECLTLIQTYDQLQLLTLWKAIKDRESEQSGWPAGKAFELLILRSFQLEGADVVWPFRVNMFQAEIEQIDGVAHLSSVHLSVLIESKDQKTAVNIEPIAKMRNQLQRRPNSVIGSVFSVNGFTDPALTLAKFVFPQTILLWNPQDIEYSIETAKFTYHLQQKYRHCVEQGSPDFNIAPL